MEIRNIYEDYSGDERLYSVLMNEDEIALFSALEQREFNSRSQKALRRAWDLRKGLAASGETLRPRGRNEQVTVGNIMDEIRGIGRRKSREISSFAGDVNGRGVHESINNKARRLIKGNAVSGRVIDSETARLANSDYRKFEKYTRRSKFGPQAEYDHGDLSPWIAKDVMKMTRRG